MKRRREGESVDGAMVVRNVMIGLSGVLSLFVGAMFALAGRDRYPPPPPAPIAATAPVAVMRAEASLATQLGMRVTESLTGAVSPRTGGETGSWFHALALGADECIAVVVGAHGYYRLEAVGLQEQGQGIDRVSNVPPAMVRANSNNGLGLATQVQWCTHEPRQLVVVAELRNIAYLVPNFPQTGTVVATVLRGPWSQVGGPGRLTRGQFDSTALEGLGPEVAKARAAALFPTLARAQWMPVAVGAARLVPAQGGVYRTLLQAVQARDDEPVNPRVEARPVPGMWFVTGQPIGFAAMQPQYGNGMALPPVHDAVVQVGDRAFQRVLGVVDASALGRCVEVGWVREVVGVEATLSRFDLGTRTVTEVAMQENAAVERRCPQDGPAVYVTRDVDHAQWSVSVVAQ